MPRPRTVFACSHCGAQQPRWLGRCPDCAKWDTLVEEPVGGSDPPAAAPAAGGLLAGAPASGGAAAAVPLGAIDMGDAPRLPSGVDELDRVLGGGLVPGSVTLLGGEPGVGKSTLALQVAGRLQQAGLPVLYVSAEESARQVALRAERLPEVPKDLRVLAETRVEALAEPWRALEPAMIVVDSIQTVRCAAVDSAPGSVGQVRESAAMLTSAAKESGSALLLVGQVTKDGTLAGPRVLEHLVDVVLALEGERAHAFRLLRAHKNRFGSTQEVGVFAMGEQGMAGVPNPSQLFLAERGDAVPGSCVVPLLEGSRPMLVEIQSLVAPAPYGTPRRTCLGVEDGRVALLLAVLDRHSPVDLLSCDVYVSAVAGVRVGEPAADLAIALAIASSRLGQPVPRSWAACGEIGLGGEIRRVPRVEARVREAARLGFERVWVPARSGVRRAIEGCRPVPVATLAEAVESLSRAGAEA